MIVTGCIFAFHECTCACAANNSTVSRRSAGGATPPPSGECGNVVIVAARKQAEVDLLWEDFTGNKWVNARLCSLDNRFCALAINAR